MAESSKGRIRFLGRVPPHEGPIYNELAHVLIATYDPSLKNNRLGAPNKLFESMSSGRPIVVTKGSFAGQIVERTGCGLTVNYEGRIALVAILKLLENNELYSKCSNAGKLAYEEKYNWPAQERKLLAIYSGLLK